MSITYERTPGLGLEEVVSLYDDVGWGAYTSDSGALIRAFENSTFVVAARDGAELVGLARCISDDVSICYLQDILVRRDHQRTGVGRGLFERCATRFRHVRSFVLMTDDDPRQEAFYTSMGLHNLSDNPTLRMFVRNRPLDA